MKFVKKVAGKTGRKILLRYPEKGDVLELMRYINELVEENTFIAMDKKVNEEQEKSYVEGILKNIKAKEQIVILAAHEKKIVGNGGVTREKGKSKHVGRMDISVSKEYRNEGIGSLLFEELINFAKSSLELKIVYLTVYGNNNRALHFYKKFGFKKCGLIPGGALHRGEYVDHVYMYKNLKEGK